MISFFYWLSHLAFILRLKIKRRSWSKSFIFTPKKSEEKKEKEKGEEEKKKPSK